MKASEIGGGPKVGEILCVLSDIKEGQAKEFSYRSGDDRVEIFIQRRGDEVFAYENSCPHAYLPLNMKEGIFTEKSGKYFMCQNHGALFDIRSGQCLGGPCNGQGLTKIEIELKEGDIIAL
ncbi:MAG: ferredoxin [Alphaproteobacteria bacterium]|nr:MAG: ferredoxin [Alphaproteobacteria bacterium]